jgi:DNA-binding MarR family transcriptional regulator
LFRYVRSFFVDSACARASWAEATPTDYIVLRYIANEFFGWFMVGFAGTRGQHGATGMAKITKTEFEALAALRYRLRQFLRYSEEAAHGVGLTPQQHQALLAIKGFPRRESVTVGDLAERLQIRHQSAVGLANRLAANKLVIRKPNGGDRRRVNLTLTAHGEKLLEKLSAAHRAQLRRIGPEIETLLRRLRAKEDESGK